MSKTHVAAEPDFGTGKKKLNIYAFGILLCVILTLIPFWAVMKHDLSIPVAFVVIFLSAFLQFLTQVICFLRLNGKTEQSRMNVMSFVFTIIILIAIIAGSLWIMWALHYHMMN